MTHTLEQYLLQTIGNVPIDECLAIIHAAEQGKLIDFDVKTQLAVAVGTVLSRLFEDDRETCEHLLGRVKKEAERIKRLDLTTTHVFKPTADSSDLLVRFEAILLSIQRGEEKLAGYWWGDNDELVVDMEKQEQK